MLDEITETSEEGFFQRIMNSVLGAVAGVFLFLGSFALLWWNEGNVIAEKEAIQELSKFKKISVTAPNSKFNGKIVYGTGKLTSKEKLGDQFLRQGSYLKLSRSVEMYQWVENVKSKSKKKVGGGKKTTKTYSYKMEWKKGYEDSSRFKKQEGHVNPQLPYNSERLEVSSSRYGKFNGKSILARVNQEQSLTLNKNMLKNKSFKLNGNFFYKRKFATLTTDSIGDIRISYRVVKPGGTFSVIAKQASPTELTAHSTENGKSKLLIASGTVAPKKMIENAKAGAGTMANVLRFFGWFLMFMGINMILAPFATFLDVIPFLGSAGRFVIGLFAGAVSAVLSTITIVVGMIAHNPIALSVVILAAGGGIFFMIKKSKEKKAAANAAAGAGAGAPAQASAPPTQASAPPTAADNNEPPKATGT
jgi:hypothetical protein